MKPTLARELDLDALLMALWRRRLQRSVIGHSDQGTQYGSDDWLRFCRANNLEFSMSRRGNCWDTQYTMMKNDRPSLTRAGIGQRALALTCRLRSGVPQALLGRSCVTL